MSSTTKWIEPTVINLTKINICMFLNLDDFWQAKALKAEKSKSKFETKTKNRCKISYPLGRAWVGLTIQNIIKKGEIRPVLIYFRVSQTNCREQQFYYPVLTNKYVSIYYLIGLGIYYPRIILFQILNDIDNLVGIQTVVCDNSIVVFGNLIHQLM